MASPEVRQIYIGHRGMTIAAARDPRARRPSTATSRRCTASTPRSTPGETVAIIGANGAGKSTYLKAIAGLVRAAPDSVLFDGQPIGALGAANIVKLGIALVPEGRRLFPSLTVEENLLIGDYGRDSRGRMVARRDLCAVSGR